MLTANQLQTTSLLSKLHQSKYYYKYNHPRTLILLTFYCLISMSYYYEVVGSIKCPKIKRHPGLRLKPINKAKEPFLPGDVVLFSCETNEYAQTIKCLDNGQWNSIPDCPNPSKNVCPDLGQISHGSYNASGPFRVGTVVAFRCENDDILNQSTGSVYSNSKNNNQSTSKSIEDKQPNYLTINNANLNEVDANPSVKTTFLKSPFTPTSIGVNKTFTSLTNVNFSEMSQVKYNLTGHRVLRCLPSSKWNHPVPTCSPILLEPQSNLSLYFASAFVILIPILIFITIAQLFMRWKKRKQRTERWKQYFTDYNRYRSSKTSIPLVIKPQNSSTVAIPVTDL